MAEKVKTSSVDNLINELRSRYTEKDLETINSAFEMASTGHISQKRKSGVPSLRNPSRPMAAEHPRRYQAAGFSVGRARHWR